MELLWASADRMQSYGITVNDAQLTLVLLANTKRAKNEDYGCEFCPSLQIIRCTFPYNHVQDNALLTEILQELSVADGVRAMKDAPEPIGMWCKSVANEAN